MATKEDLTEAIGCLSTVFPQFAAKELAKLTDEILAGVQGFTDPLAAIGDLGVDSLVDDVAELSEGDIFDNVKSAAAGLVTQYVKRDAESSLSAVAKKFPGATKRALDIRNLSERIVTTGSLMMSLFPDMPYAAAQRMCELIVRLTDLKTKNLGCLQKHIIQLVNAVLVLAENTNNYVDDTFADLRLASGYLATVKKELQKSNLIVDDELVFDTQAFDRAINAMLAASKQLTPDKDGTSILDVVDILTSGSVEAGQVNRANRALSTIVIPSLISLIEAEMSAVVSQVDVINFYIKSLGEVISNFRNSANTSRIKEQRARSISDIQGRVNELCSRIDLAIKNSSLRAASGEMLFWASRSKTILALMNQVKELTREEGSIEGPDKAFLLEQAFQELLFDLTNIENSVTSLGIEDTTILKSEVLAITAGTKRILGDLERGKATPNDMATFHTLAAVTATGQVSNIEESLSVARQQKAICQTFADIDLAVRERFDELTDSMRQVGLDRGVDLIANGRFEEFLDTDVESLSYLGSAINCLTEALNGVDDIRTRQQINEIRSDLIGRRTNQDVAAADSSDQGRTRFITKIQDNLALVQRNAKLVESIVDGLKVLGEQIGANLDTATSAYASFLGNLDHLAVGAGGRLASGLEEFSDHPNAGVPLCDPV